MTIEVKHATQATGTDAGNGEIAKAEWNEAHTINMASGALLGRSTAGAGAAEEIALGSGLSLAAGVLSATGGGAVVSATPPASPSEGDQWYDERSGALFTWYVGASSSAWVSMADAVPSIPPTFISQATATTTSISTMPAHQTGDLLVMFAYNGTSTTQPTLPAGWTQITGAGANTNAYRVGIKVATGSSETSGTWTNATRLNLQVYRNVAGTGAVSASTGTGTTITYPALTLQNTNGGSAVVLFAGHRSTNTAISTPPSGSTLRSSTTTTAGFDTNGGVSSWTQQTVAVGGTSSGWYGISLELRPKTGFFTTLGTIDFPASPHVGQTYTQSGNTFLWNGTAWLFLPWVDLTSAEVTGTLPVSKGGTGLTTLTTDNVILGNGTGNPSFVAPGSTGNVLTSNGTTWVSAPASSGGGGVAVKGQVNNGSLASSPASTGISFVQNFGSYVQVYLSTTASFFSATSPTTTASALSVFNNFNGTVIVYGNSGSFYLIGFA